MKNELKMIYDIPPLPLKAKVETIRILKKLPEVRAALAELKGIAATIPNTAILVNTLTLQEAKDSSAVENIVTSHDELFKASLQIKNFKSLASKEVQHYASALHKGFEAVRKNKVITNRVILNIQRELEQNSAGYRNVPGTQLVNDRTKEVIYTPPQHGEEIRHHMDVLLRYMNEDDMDNIDPLMKMAIIHHQFESIHPFYDGNGRTGRIINILYLVAKGLLDYPVLYLSRYVNQNKDAYYRLLQDVRQKGEWEAWILYILDGIESISRQSIALIKEIKRIMQSYKVYIRDTYSYYSQDLLNNLFRHPYTKIEFLAQDLQINRKTAAKYLNELSEDPKNLISKYKIGKLNYYVNNELVSLLVKE
jgi:Fic family protein